MTEMPSPSEMAWLNRLTGLVHDGRRLGRADPGSAGVDHGLHVGERFDATRRLDSHGFRQTFAEQLDVGARRGAVTAGRVGGEVGSGGSDDPAGEADALLVEM